MCLSFAGCVARGRLGLLLVGGLLRVRFEGEGLWVRLLRRRLLMRPVELMVGRTSRVRLRCLGPRLWVAWAVFVIVVATGFESVVVAGLAVAVIVLVLAQEAELALVRQQERSLAERTALVWAAVWIVHYSAAVLALRSAMRRWWSAQWHLGRPWWLHSFTRDWRRYGDT